MTYMSIMFMTLHSLQWSFPNSLGKGQTLGSSKTLFLFKIGEYTTC